MKKTLFLMLTAMSFVLISCSKNDDSPSKSTLNGTTWISPDDGDGERTIIFGDGTFRFTLIYKGKTEIDKKGTYVYSKPNVTLSDGTKGVVVGNTMTLGEDAIEYKKQ